jgi:hypothetical protein
MSWTRRESWRLINFAAVYDKLQFVAARDGQTKVCPTSKGDSKMPKYVIEREIPGAGKMSPEQLQAASQTSCGVLQKMGPQIQWQQSYVTGDKLYCIYIAPNEDMIREHAQQGGFPANRISEIKTIIDPTTAEA